MCVICLTETPSIKLSSIRTTIIYVPAGLQQRSLSWSMDVAQDGKKLPRQFCGATRPSTKLNAVDCDFFFASVIRTNSLYGSSFCVHINTHTHKHTDIHSLAQIAVTLYSL